MSLAAYVLLFKSRLVLVGVSFKTSLQDIPLMRVESLHLLTPSLCLVDRTRIDVLFSVKAISNVMLLLHIARN